jgi:glutamate-1-semialdehyde 2,1-aminomutase
MLGLFFRPGEVRCFEDAKASDLQRFARYYRGMLAAGVYLAPSQFEALFVSLAHDETAIEATLEAAQRVLAELAT